MFADTKLTRGQLLDLHHILETTNFDNPMGNRFRYAVTKNLEVSKKEIDEINLAFPVPDKFNDYAKKRSGIYAKYKVNDEAAYKELPEETKIPLDEEIKQLETDSKELLDEMDATDKEKIEFLKEEITVKLYKLDIDLLPTISKDNKYSGWDIWAILLKYMIIEPND